MKKLPTGTLLATMLVALPINNTFATEAETTKVTEEVKAPFQTFTGKITKNKVRMRLNPSLDSPIIRELNQREMVIVVEEDDEFYAVAPLEDIKAYIFRTYVLDGVVEGHHVNIRLEPTLDSPVIAQLNTGDSVTGRVSPINSKWLEIIPPASTKFYVSKDYLEKVGDANYMAKVNKRKNKVNQLLDTAYMASSSSLKRPFEEVDYEEVVSKYDQLINNYQDFEEQTIRARELLVDFKDQYTKKKIAYLEAKSKSFIDSETLQKENSRLNTAYQTQQEKLEALERQVGNVPERTPKAIIGATWIPKEETFYETWIEENGERPMREFYRDELAEANTLNGTLQPYTRNVKNKPGDFVLLNSNNTPIAFLYSTKINLQDYVGQKVSVKGNPRPNNRFAYSAFHVLTLE